MKNLLAFNSDNIVRQSALVSECDGTSILTVDNASVILYKNECKGVERSCKLPLNHSLFQGLITLEIPLSKEDVDTTGCLCIYVKKSGSLNSCGVYDIHKSQ